MRLSFLLLLLACSSLGLVSTVAATDVTIPFEWWFSTIRDGQLIPAIPGPTGRVSAEFGVQDVFEYDSDLLSPGLNVTLEFFDDQYSAAVALNGLINYSEKGYHLIVGNPLSGVLAVTGRAAGVYDMAQLTGTASTALLSDKSLYPLVSRSSSPSTQETGAAADFIRYFYANYGRGWNEVAVLSTTDEYGVTTSKAFIAALEGTEIEVLTYQQFLSGANITVEMNEIARSGARVIIVYTIQDYTTTFAAAERAGLLDDSHVWLVANSIVDNASGYTFTNGSLNTAFIEQMRGTVGTTPLVNTNTDRYRRYLAKYQAIDPNEITGAGPGTTPGYFNTQAFDLGVLAVYAASEADKQGLFDNGGQPSGTQWSEIIRGLSVEGATGNIRFDQNGDRPFAIVFKNFRPDNRTWPVVANWTRDDGITILGSPPIVWHDNTTNVPDLDIRPPFKYWSCDDKKKGYDETGKTIKLHTPDGGSFDDIDADYYCDSFIDCHNMSDEGSGCSTNYIALFIAFGIITGILILMTCCLLPFVVVFGFIIPRRRVRASSPPFLIIIILSSIVGFASTYAWYGKPHPVACGFQPWLLGLAVVSMVAALLVKTFRLWRIFRVKFSREVYSDASLFILYILMCAPAVLILIIWTIVSTPTAKMDDRGDDDHWVCATGGFTGYPGGLVFFFIYVGWTGGLLLFGAFLSIVTRNIPSFFNESKLVAISIYNLGFLSVVVIPVFLVLQEFNPFAAWIIRTVAILYAFAATLVLQFLPQLVGVIIIDRGGDAEVPTTMTKTESTYSQTM